MKNHCYLFMALLLFISFSNCKKEVQEIEIQEFNRNFKQPILNKEDLKPLSLNDMVLRDKYLNSDELNMAGLLESRTSTLASPITVQIYSECLKFPNCSTSHLSAYLADKDGNSLGTLYAGYGPYSKVLYNLPASNNQYELNIYVSSYTACTDLGELIFKVSSPSSGSKYFRLIANSGWYNIDILQPGYIVQGSSSILYCQF